MVYERKRLFSLNFQFFMANNQRYLPRLYSLNKNVFQIFVIKNSQIFDVPFIRYQINYFFLIFLIHWNQFNSPAQFSLPQTNNQRHLPWLYSLNKNVFQIFFIKNSQIFDVPFNRYQINYFFLIFLIHWNQFNSPAQFSLPQIRIIY